MEPITDYTPWDEVEGWSGNTDIENYGRFREVMDYYGYQWEDVKVTTEDGYILTMFHITGKVGSGSLTVDKPPILISHGMMCDATSWIEDIKRYGGESLPFQLQLAEEGYDVWLMNQRGTWYSMEHETLDAAVDEQYWLFDST